MSTSLSTLLRRGGRLLYVTCIVLVAAAIRAEGPAPSPAARDALRRLLKTADDRGPQALANAQRQFAVASRHAADERTVRYAYGVVLMRLLKPRDAQEQFTLAADAGQDIYPPAAKALAAALLTSRQWPAAVERLQKLAQALQETPAAWSPPALRTGDAAWLGQVVAAATYLPETGKDVDLFTALDARLRETLPADLQAAYRQGFDRTLQLHEMLADTAADKRDQVKADQQQERTANRKDVNERQGQLKAERENLKLTAEEWKKYLDQRQAEYSKQLGKLEKEWNYLDQRRQSLERSILLTHQEMNILYQQYAALQQAQQNSNGNRGVTTQNTGLNRLQILDSQLAQRQLQLLQYQAEHQQTSAREAGVHQQASGVVAEQQRLVAEYEQATGQLVKRDESLKKWNERLAKKDKELAAEPSGENASTKSLAQKLKSLNSYVPADWEAERQRLLAELGGK